MKPAIDRFTKNKIPPALGRGWQVDRNPLRKDAFRRLANQPPHIRALHLAAGNQQVSAHLHRISPCRITANTHPDQGTPVSCLTAASNPPHCRLRLLCRQKYGGHAVTLLQRATPKTTAQLCFRAAVLCHLGTSWRHSSQSPRACSTVHTLNMSPLLPLDF